MQTLAAFRDVQRATGRGLSVFLRDVGHGALELGHNTLALVGLATVAAAIFAVGRPDLRHEAESVALNWLQDRFEQRAVASGDLLAVVGEPTAVARATAADPAELTREQASVARWLSRRYRVAPEPVARLVKEAWDIGQRSRLDPTLLLAIIAIESSFNPFAQSSVGAQGLMQVMTRVHDDKYEAFGGVHAAFDPVSNLRVGAQILKEYVRRTGSVEGGLKHYVGAALLETDGGYAAKVLYEQSHIQRVAQGQSVAVNVPSTPPAPPPEPEALPADTAAERVAIAPQS
ncbi:transglycosylase SLT domain-containing protein [Rubrivivax albus]|uniref:Lytic transglycosylase domain-containing protein n=1 Tax=Rubrivivax albus TaxID=2499835 RepID=A0A437JS76_9BURK|nr:transglycosylase SLT domain-containing protein [Rubrivivax albus]RVT49719.1 lytic transglycosylase domain-containing protein [Rubrivivax albus]